MTAILDAPAETEVEAPAETELLADLRALRALLEDPARWTQFKMARDARGARIGPFHSSAVSWCLAGGIIRVAGVSAARIVGGVRVDNLFLALQTAVRLRTVVSSVSAFNDLARHHEVLDVIDDAISREEQT
jgi:hypothetical protein